MFWTKGYLNVCFMYAYIHVCVAFISIYLIYCYIGIGRSGIKCAYNEDTVATLTECSRPIEFVSLSTCPGSIWDRALFLPSRWYSSAFWI